MRKLILPLLVSAATAAAQDAPAIDPAKLLEALKSLKDQQATQAKTARQNVLKAAQSGAASGPAAAAAWMEAVRLTQFEGAEKEGAQFRDWKDREGALFSEKEVQAAAQLHYRWLVLTTQHALGTPVKDLLPSIIQYTKDVLTDAAVMDGLVEKNEKDKDRATQRPGAARNMRNASETDRIKRLHDQILNRALPASPPARALRAEELVKAESWELTPGDVDGIYAKIILPELRKSRDPRVVEYWDMKIKLEGDAAKNGTAFEQEKFNVERRGELLWNRGKEFAELGLRNRCINELFQVLRTFPQHPSFGTWVGELEQVIAPASAAPATGVPAAK